TGRISVISLNTMRRSMRIPVPTAIVVVLSGAIAAGMQSVPIAPGAQTFASRCASCHGTDGNGGELGPAITARVPLRTDEELQAVIRQGMIGAGMPAFGSLNATEVGDVIRHLRTLRPRTGSGPARAKISLAGGGTIDGLVFNQGPGDLQLFGDDRK